MKLNKLAIIQGTFISVQKTINSLGSIDSGDKRSLDIVTEKIFKVIKSEDFENEDLQRVFLLLFLNTNTKIYEQLRTDDKFKHIVGYMPLISKHILAKLIIGLNLEPYLYNSITFIEGKIGYELLNIVDICLQMVDEFDAIDFVENLSEVLYKKLSFTEDSHEMFLLHNLLTFYEKPCKNIVNSIVKWEKTKMYHFSGLVMYSLLTLLQEFLEFYDKKEFNKPKGHDVFDIFPNIKNSTGQENQNKSNCNRKDLLIKCCDLLISISKNNMAAVTIDVYLYWAEVDLDDAPNTDNTLQRKICEKAFICNAVLVEAEKSGLFSSQINDIINYLSGIAVKPHEQQQPEVDISIIIQNLKDNDSIPTDWIKKLILSFEFEEDIVELLIKKVKLLDSDCRKELFKKGVEFADKNTDCPECIKQLVLEIVRNEEVDFQIKVLEDFIHEYGLKKILMLNNFENQCTGMFNKVLNDETKHKEMYPDFISLAMQDGETVVKLAVDHAINSEIKGKLMTEVLQLLYPVWRKSFTENEAKSNLLIDIVKNIFHDVVKMTDNHKICYSLFVSELLRQNLINGSDLLYNIIEPLMDVSKMIGEPEEVAVHSLGLDLIDELLKVTTEMPSSVILALLLDVLEENRCYVQYDYDMMAVCDKAISLINLIVSRSIQNTNNISVDEKAWLKNKIKNHKKINAEHLAKLFPEDDKCPDNSIDSLFYSMHRRTSEWNVLELGVETRSKISIALSSVLVSLTRSEWEMMFQTCAPDNEHFIALFEIVSEAVFLIKSLFDSYNCEESSQVCLEYCLLNAGRIINQNITLWDEIDEEGMAKVFLKFCFIMRELHSVRQERCSLTLVETMKKLLKIILNKKPVEESIVYIITAGIIELKVKHVRKELLLFLLKEINIVKPLDNK